MNKLIRKLMDECVSFRIDPDSNAEEAQISPEDLESFAWLLILECISATDEWYRYHNEIHWDPSEHIKQHFGGEE